MALTEREYQQYIILSRQVALQQGLDTYTDTQLIAIRKMLKNSTDEIIRELNNRIATQRLTEWTADRAGALLNEAERLTAGIQTRLADDIASTATSAGLEALKEHNSIVSWSGMVGGFTNVSLSSAQLKSFMFSTPVHGYTLKNWVDRTFTREMQTKIREEIATGVFRGKGYPDLVNRIKTAFTDLTNREAITLTRSYVQAANVNAMKSVYDQNADIVEQVKWSAILENGFRSSGRGTCLICAGLDGNVYPKDDHPLCPIHPRCRCNLLPVTKTFRELGLNIDEVEQVHRPYTIRQDKNIDVGGRRKIREVGQHQGNYGSWFEQQSDRTRLNIVGPNRKRMLDNGEIRFSDLVNPRTGRVLTLQELDAGVMIRPVAGAPGSMEILDAWGFKQGTKSSILAEELLYNPLSSKEIKALEWNTYNHDFPPIRAKLAKQGVLFKDGNGRFYTIKPQDIDDHARLGLKGLIEKKKGGGGPSPLPPDPGPVKPDASKIKDQVRKLADFKSGSKSEQLLEGLMDRPMTGKEIKEFMNSAHDFPAVRKKLVDLGIIEKGKDGKWIVKALQEDGPSPIVKPPSPKPKSKPVKQDTVEYWKSEIKKIEDKVVDLVEMLPQINYVPDPVKFREFAKTYKFVNQINKRPWSTPKFNASEKAAMKKILKEHDKILKYKAAQYKVASKEVRQQMRRDLLNEMTIFENLSPWAKEAAEREILKGTSHYTYEILEDLNRNGLKIYVENTGRAYFSAAAEKVQLFADDLRNGEVVAHEIGHSIDSLMSGKGRKFSNKMGLWQNNPYSTKEESLKYIDWYERAKTGGKGTYKNGGGKYWLGNWVSNYEGRVYNNLGVGEQYWAMNNQRFYSSVRYYKDNLDKVNLSKVTTTSPRLRELETKLNVLRKGLLEAEDDYFDGKLGKDMFKSLERDFQDEIDKINKTIQSEFGQVGNSIKAKEYSSKEELWLDAQKRGDWLESKTAYPEFSEWFENDFMKRQGISWETDFDG